jgi:MFS transporter, NNP family, nitrate/nitrite transporter
MTAVEQRLPDTGSRGRWITDWRPEDPVFWERTGARVARRNLAFSIFAEHVGFSVWSLWSVLVLFLGPAYHVDPSGKFVLTMVPTAIGAALRLPYTFAVARFGGRTWTMVSAALLLVPAGLAATLIEPGVSYGTLLALAAVAGVGGGNFASSMANINAYFPDRLKGWALASKRAAATSASQPCSSSGSWSWWSSGRAIPGWSPASTCRRSCSPRSARPCSWTTSAMRATRSGQCAT